MNKEVIRTTFEENPFYEDKKLPPLTKVTIDDVKEWLLANRIQTNPRLISDLVKKYFQPLAASEPDEAFYMADAEIEMEKIIAEYNSKKP